MTHRFDNIISDALQVYQRTRLRALTGTAYSVGHAYVVHTLGLELMRPLKSRLHGEFYGTLLGHP